LIMFFTFQRIMAPIHQRIAPARVFDIGFVFWSLVLYNGVHNRRPFACVCNQHPLDRLFSRHPCGRPIAVFGV
jgi:hypothetical protein